VSETVINGIKIHYKVEGQGKPLLLIGGFDSSLQTWGRQSSVFKNYFKVITFDARGTGRSSRPSGPYTIIAMATDVIGLLDSLKIKKAHILGVSLGGLVAQEVVLQFPERVGKLVLATTFANISEASGPTPEIFRIMKLPFFRMLDGMAELMLNRRLYRLMLLPVAFVKNRLACRPAILSKSKAAYQFDSTSRLPCIKEPTLVLTGTADRVILPSSSDKLATLIPGSKLVKVEGKSHVFFIENPDVFNRIVLNFLMEI